MVHIGTSGPRDDACMTTTPSVRDTHRAALAALPPAEWTEDLDAHSGLPGPRGNLELLDVVAETAPAAALRAWAGDADEYRATVGAAGLGRLVAEGQLGDLETLRSLAADGRWRVREGVAMALQRLGDVDLARMQAVADAWSTGPPLVQRAAIAGECEPRLLRSLGAAAHAVALLDRVTRSLISVADRRSGDVRALRKALGYCWSVAVAADPVAGFPALAAWASSTDADVRWVVRTNLRKARLARADAEATRRLAALLG